MTHNLKEIIEAEVESKYRYDGPHVKFAFKEGCNFMAGKMEGLLEWAKRKHTCWIMGDGTMEWKNIEDFNTYTTSQLVDKYFEHINSKG